MKPEGESRTFDAAIACRYLLEPPETPAANPLLVVALHGYGSNAEAMLRLTRRMAGGRHAIASIQGPHQFYANAEDFQSPVAYGWGTRNDMAGAIAAHHRMVRHVLEEAGGLLGIPADRAVLAGFSQPVSLNYRFAAAFPDVLGGVIGICGGLPGEWERSPAPRIAPAVLHIARELDPYYPPERARDFERLLRAQAHDVEFRLLPGGHRIPSNAAAIVEPWLARVEQNGAAKRSTLRS